LNSIELFEINSRESSVAIFLIRQNPSAFKEFA